MKKTFQAAFASLMLAGVLSAFSGLKNDQAPSNAIAIAGDGTSPIALVAASVDDPGSHSSINKYSPNLDPVSLGA